MSAPAAPAKEPFDPTLRVSYSSMTKHRQCPQAWSYRYLRGLETTGPTTARDLGSWWHLVRAMDSIERGTALGSLRFVPDTLQTGAEGLVLRRDPDSPSTDGNDPRECYRLPNGTKVPATREVALAVTAAYWRTLGGDEQDGWVEEIGEPLPDRIAYMDARWRERWADDLPHEAPLGVEVKFQRLLPAEPGDTGTVSGAVLIGYVDEVYLDTRRSLVVARDHKTHRTMPSQSAADDLSDSQTHLYGWGAAPLVEEWGHGTISALSYDRVRSAKPKTPTVTVSGGLSKSVSDYDRHTYETFAAGPDGAGVPWGTPDTWVQSGPRKGKPKWGTYEADPAVAEKLSTPAAQSGWHQRTLTPLNANIVKAHLAATVHTRTEAVRTMAFFDEHAEAPRNFTRQGCKWCDYAKLCRAELLGGTGGDYALDQFNLTQPRIGRRSTP